MPKSCSQTSYANRFVHQDGWGFICIETQQERTFKKYQQYKKIFDMHLKRCETCQEVFKDRGPCPSLSKQELLEKMPAQASRMEVRYDNMNGSTSKLLA